VQNEKFHNFVEEILYIILVQVLKRCVFGNFKWRKAILSEDWSSNKARSLGYVAKRKKKDESLRYIKRILSYLIQCGILNTP